VFFIDFIKKHKGFFFLLFFILAWIILVSIFPPDKIVEVIGVQTGYFIMFLTAFIGVSGFASAPFYATLVTMVSTGEFNLIVLSLVVAPARAFGDSLFFILGYQGHFVAKEKLGKVLNFFSLWLSKKPGWVIFLFAYFYTSLTPLPQDILMVILGLGKASFKKILPAVLLGNATFVFLVSYLVSLALI